MSTPPQPISVPRVHDITGRQTDAALRNHRDYARAEKQLREGSKRVSLPYNEWMRRIRQTRSF